MTIRIIRLAPRGGIPTNRKMLPGLQPHERKHMGLRDYPLRDCEAIHIFTNGDELHLYEYGHELGLDRRFWEMSLYEGSGLPRTWTQDYGTYKKARGVFRRIARLKSRIIDLDKLIKGG